MFENFSSELIFNNLYQTLLEVISHSEWEMEILEETDDGCGTTYRVNEHVDLEYFKYEQGELVEFQVSGTITSITNGPNSDWLSIYSSEADKTTAIPVNNIKRLPCLIA